MVIRDLSRKECLQVLEKGWLARLACAFENKPYVVPVYLAYRQDPNGVPCLYGFTTEGQKVAWMRSNPCVCVELDEVVSASHWVSVLVFGHFKELPLVPALTTGRSPPARHPVSGRNEAADHADLDPEVVFAHQVLQKHAMWWEPATMACRARTQGDTAHPFTPIYYKVLIDQLTGHEASNQVA